LTIALYPGTFDPVTYGHIDIATRAAAMFERVVVAVYDAPPKQLVFNTNERVALFQEAIRPVANIQVISYTGLTVAFARHIGARVIVRGLRMVSDFELEYRMATNNRQLAPEIDMVCLMSNYKYAYVSATLVKEIARLGGPVDAMVMPHVAQALAKKFGTQITV